MKINRFFFLLLLPLVWAQTSCKQQSTTTSKPVITVTIAPQKYFAELIGGDKFKIETMVPNGSSPETYDPSPQQLVSLSNSKAYFKIGYIGFELAWLDKMLVNAPNVSVFDCSKGVDLIHSEEACGHQHQEKTDHHSYVEPHIWCSTINARVIAGNMLHAMIELAPNDSTLFTDNYHKLIHSINEVEQSIQQSLANMDQKSFMIYHPSLTYFARDFGLNQITIEAEGKEPSPNQLKSLIDLATKERVGVIFVQAEFDQKNASLIAKQTGTRVILINPLAYDWKKEMLHLTNALHGE